MARVFKGWDTTLDRQVAIKILHEHLLTDPVFKERFDREAKLVATLNHPNIVQIYDYDTVVINGQTVCFMVMPFFPGTTLEDLLIEHNSNGLYMPTKRVVEILTDLCAALGYAHKHGMIHRDIKPSNIMFDEHNRAILTDFGIARLKEARNLTQDGATVGTPSYMSPEQAAGIAIDGRSDLYALGIIAYEMLTGEVPYTGENIFSVILQHAHAPIPALPVSVSSANVFVQSFIYKALAKDPQDRYQTAAEFADALKWALQESTLTHGNKQTIIDQTNERHDAKSPTAYLTGNETQNITPDFIRLAAQSSMQPVSNPSPKRHWPPIAIPAVLGIGFAIAIILVTTNNTPTVGNGNLKTATAISSMTQDQGQPFRSDFSTNNPTTIEWQQNRQGDVTRSMTDNGLYKIENNLPGTAASALFNPEVTFLNATISMEAMLDTSSADTSALGIIFRYQDESNYYVFAIDGMARYSIWRLNAGVWQELRGLADRWTESEFILSKGQSNFITLTFTNDQVTGYVNNHALTTLSLDANMVTPGAVGVYIASSNNGAGIALVDTFEVGNQVFSMTADSP